MRRTKKRDSKAHKRLNLPALLLVGWVCSGGVGSTSAAAQDWTPPWEQAPDIVCVSANAEAENRSGSRPATLIDTSDLSEIIESAARLSAPRLGMAPADDTEDEDDTIDWDMDLDMPAAPAPEPSIPSLVNLGPRIGKLSADECSAILTSASIPHHKPEIEAPDVSMPVILDGNILGISIGKRGQGADERDENPIDCRLVVALAAWAPALRELGVARLEHFSILRPGAQVRGTRNASGHAFGLAIDVGRFILDDGTTLEVEDDWVERTRGVDPCAVTDNEPGSSQLMRRAVCEAARNELFQVILTPHFDHAHRNHVHLEVRPNVDWSFVH